MKIGIFGGSFDPIHLGHVIAARQVLEKKICDKIWFMPCFQNPLKPELTQAVHRKKMIELAIQDNEKFELNETELKKEKVTFTIDTLKELKKEFPEHEFYFIIAGKALKEIKKWKNWKELLTEIKLVIILTSSKELPKEIKKFNPIQLEKTVSGNISSTLIKKRIEQGKDALVFLPEKVLEYIKENKLYGFK